MPNYVCSLWLLCHFTRATKNLLWVGRKKMEERYYNYKSHSTTNNFFKLCVASERNFRCNSQPEMVSSEVHHTLLKCFKKVSFVSFAGFGNYHKIIICDHIHVPNIWCMWRMSANTKKYISGIKPFP